MVSLSTSNITLQHVATFVMRYRLKTVVTCCNNVSSIGFVRNLFGFIWHFSNPSIAGEKVEQWLNDVERLFLSSESDDAAPVKWKLLETTDD